MANFLAVYDPVKKRRIKFTDKCRKEIAIFESLKCDQISNRNFSLLWAANKYAPIDIYQNKTRAAVLFGDAIRPGTQERIKAKKITQEWNELKNAQKNHYDGYYCSVFFDKNKGLMVGGDILGLFPIYYYSNSKITLAGSSPELFQHHECFEPELNKEGLSGMLMTMHSVEGLTLWKNVWRLREGHLLIAPPNQPACEKLQYKIPISDTYYNLSFGNQIELIHENLAQAVSRHAPKSQKYSLLFSGGLDTRMLAGYLKERKSDITAITFGKASDIEMKVAKKAVKKLPFKHETFDIPFKKYPGFAALTAKWEHGLHGFNTIDKWYFNQLAHISGHKRFISGIHHDSVFYSPNLELINKNESLKQLFNQIVSKMLIWGIKEEKLQKLFIQNQDKYKPKKLLNKLENRFLNYYANVHSNVWCFRLFHRARFHHGGVLWKMSFGGWPVIPIIDSALLEIMGGLPCATMSGRRAQKALVATYFPDLAKIPLDNNSDHPMPLMPTWQSLLKQKLSASTFFKNRIFNAIKYRLTGPWHKNLYYHRMYNLDNTGWKSIRNVAEPNRTRTNGIFNQKNLDELLPPPQQNLDRHLGDASGIKSLLGFLLWMKTH